MECNHFHIAERCFEVFDLEFNFVKSRQCTEFVGLWFVIWSWWVSGSGRVDSASMTFKKQEPSGGTQPSEVGKPAHSLTTTYILHIPSPHGLDYWETSLEITTERPGRMKHHTHYPTFAECSPAFLSCCSNSATPAEAADSCSAAFLSSCVILHRISL